MGIKEEVIDIIAETSTYLMFLKETGVEEVFAKSKEEVRNKKQEAREGAELPPPLNPLPQGEGRLEWSSSNPIPVTGGDAQSVIPPPLTGGGQGEGELRLPSDDNKAILLNTLQEKIGDCKRCKLSTGRTSIVFGTGNPNTRLVFVGEWPGEDEDKQGKPFVGKAGELLTKMITAMGLTRDDVYIANVVKCHPPGNRNPEADEITACSPFLKEEIDIIKPEILCTLGAFTSQTLLETTTKISELRGKIHLKDGYKIVPTFHPAYLLRNQGEKSRSWQDLQMIMKELRLKMERE